EENSSSPSAIARIITVAVCVAPFPPTPAMTGMKVTRAMISCRVPSNRPTTEAAKVAVIKFNMVHGSRIFHRARDRREDTILLRQPGHLVHVFGGFFVDNVDNVVNRNNSLQSSCFIDNGQGKQLVF